VEAGSAAENSLRTGKITGNFLCLRRFRALPDLNSQSYSNTSHTDSLFKPNREFFSPEQAIAPSEDWELNDLAIDIIYLFLSHLSGRHHPQPATLNRGRSMNKGASDANDNL
jgi:hypothetical protein